MDVLQDTRDLVMRLDERFGAMEKRVEKNSVILEELRDLHKAAKTSWSLGKAVVSVGRYVVTGVSGGGLIWLVQNFPKTAG